MGRWVELGNNRWEPVEENTMTEQEKIGAVTGGMMRALFRDAKPGSDQRKALLNGPFAVKSFPDSGQVFVVTNYGRCVAQIDDLPGLTYTQRVVLADAMATGLNEARNIAFGR